MSELLQRVPRWDACSLAERLHTCRVMLLIHGYLRESESDRIKQRIARDAHKAMALSAPDQTTGE